MWRHVGNAVIGAVLVAAVYCMLIPIFFFAAVMAMPVPDIFLFDAVFLGLVAAMVAIAARKRRWGFVAAPFVFAALWFAAAVAQRAYFQVTDDPKLAERPVPTELRDIRTLIVETPVGPTCCGQTAALANGTIDLYVHAAQDGYRRVISAAAFRLARRSACTSLEIGRAAVLERAGRTDQCIHEEPIDSTPDGVVVRLERLGASSSSGACCARGTISVRAGGNERLAATWYYGERTILSYFPLYGTDGEPTPLWAMRASGPVQHVEIGGPAFDLEDLAGAVYGIEWRATINPAAGTSPR